MDYCRFIVAQTLVLIAILSGQVNAQDSTAAEEKQWYQIELVIFASNNPEAGYEEQWPEELGLSYPDTVSPIKDTLNNIKTPTAVAPLENAEQIANSEAVEATAVLPQPLVAFTQLTEDQLQLTEAANKIINQYDFRPLFHKAWRQTVNDRDNAISIIVTGGEAYDEHYELEGTVKISVERYLHINTDLWLNQFVSKTGQDQPSWPLLPAIPINIDESNATDLDITLEATNNFDASNIDLTTGTLLDNGSNIEKNITDGLENAPITDILSGANKALEQQLKLMSDAQYAVERTVVMRQHRRMRSKELHYIDHPLFGLLIKIIPYDRPLDDQANQTEASES
jgi:hypothetical protein